MLFVFKIRNLRIGVKKEIVIPLLFLTFTLVYFQSTFGLSDNALVFPRFLMVILAFCGAVTLAGCFCQLSADQEFARDAPLLSKIVVLFCGLLILFICAFNFLGVYVSLFLFSFAAMFLAGRRNWLVMAFVGIGVCIFIWAVFSLWLEIRMPLGLLGKFL